MNNKEHFSSRMFGPYEIEYEGRRYFGNVSLREHHVFEYDGNTYLVDVVNMGFRPITPSLAVMIDRVASSFGSLIPDAVMLQLRRLNLVAGEDDESSEATAVVHSGESTRKPGAPVVSIGLFIAQECNMRCVYCYGDGGEYGAKGMMSEETAFRAVDWLLDNSMGAEKVNICFFGGEPLLSFPLMQKVVSYSRKKAAEKGKQVDFSMTTNGSLLTDEVIKFIEKERIDPMISFDGPPEIQNLQRPFKDGIGSYDRVYANVQKLRAVLPNLKARATVYGDADPFLIKQGMERAGFTTCFLTKASPLISNGQPAEIPSEGTRERRLQRMLAFNRMETDRLLSIIRERRINRDCPPNLLFCMLGICSGRKTYHGCAIGKNMAGISVTGDVYPCHRFVGQKDMRMGNIADYRVEGLNDYYRAIVDHLPECRICWARYCCGGGCFYQNKALTGDMHGHDRLDCRERKTMYEGLIHVYCRLDEGDKEYLKEILRDAKTEPHP